MGMDLWTTLVVKSQLLTRQPRLFGKITVQKYSLSFCEQNMSWYRAWQRPLKII